MPELTDYVTNSETVPKKSKTSATSKKPAKSPRRSRSTSVKKAKPAAKTSAFETKVAPPLPTDEDVRLRAFFIAERRTRLALPGDASSDWLEARRQLLSEVEPR